MRAHRALFVSNIFVLSSAIRAMRTILYKHNNFYLGIKQFQKLCFGDLLGAQFGSLGQFAGSDVGANH
jgi:hypothetical protein